MSQLLSQFLENHMHAQTVCTSPLFLLTPEEQG